MRKDKKAESKEDKLKAEALLFDVASWEGNEKQINEASSEIKTEQELARFTVNDALGEPELLAVLLASPHAVQRRAAVDRLPHMLRAHRGKGYAAIKSPLDRAVAEMDAEGLTALSESFSAVVAEGCLSQAETAECLLPVCLAIINAQKDKDVLDAWLAVVDALVPRLTPAAVKATVVGMALSKGAVASTVLARVACCRLLGAAAPALDRAAVTAAFFDRAMALCQDADYEVRIVMCRVVPAIALAVGPELTKDAVLGEVYELLRDEENAVRLGALGAAAALMEHMPPEDRRRHVYSALRAAAHSTEDDAASTAGRLLPTVVAKAAQDMEDEGVFGELLAIFAHQAAAADAGLREAAAAAFPTVLKAVGARRYAQHLHTLLVALSRDADEAVRRAVASGLPESAGLLGRERVMTYLRDIHVALLRDASLGVQGEALRRLGATLPHLAVANDSERAAAYAQLLPLALAALAAAGHDWRLESDFLACLPAAQDHFSAEAVSEFLFPLCLRCMASGAVPVQEAAAAALAQLLRRHARASHRAEVLGRVGRDFARGRSCRARLAFCALSAHVASRFSRRFFREHFLEASLDCLADPVPNVRTAACALLGPIRASLRVPEDQGPLDRLSLAAVALAADRDRDVSAAAAAEAHRVTSPWGFGGAAAANAEDKAREREEEDLGRREEMERKRDGGDLAKRRSVDASAGPAAARSRSVRDMAHGGASMADLGASASSSSTVGLGPSQGLAPRGVPRAAASSSSLLGGRASGGAPLPAVVDEAPPPTRAESKPAAAARGAPSPSGLGAGKPAGVAAKAGSAGVGAAAAAKAAGGAGPAKPVAAKTVAKAGSVSLGSGAAAAASAVAGMKLTKSGSGKELK